MYIKLTQEQIEKADKYGLPMDLANKLSQLSYPHVTPKVTAGASGATVTEFVFIAPTKLTIEKCSVIIDTPNVGTGNTPDVKLMNGNTVLATANIALSKSAGDIVACTLNSTPANLVIDEGTALKVSVVNPAGTITTALSCKMQFDWHATV